MMDQMHLIVLRGLQQRMASRGCRVCRRLMAGGGCSALGRADGRAGCPFFVAVVVPPKMKKVVQNDKR